MKRILDALFPAGEKQRFSALDGLRALAAGAVVLHHQPLLRDGAAGVHGHLAVTVFFVLSAFLLYYPWAKERARRDLLRYYRNRVWRIFPLYLIVLNIAALAALAAGKPVTRLGYVSHLLFVHSFFPREVSHQLLPAAWSLPGEIQFYLLLPLIAWFIAGRQFPLLLLLTSAGVAVQLLAPSAGRAHAWTPDVMNWPFLSLPFFLGMLAAWLVANHPRRCRRFAAVGLLGLGYYVFALASGQAQQLLQSSLPLYSLFNYRGVLPSLFAFLAVAGLAANPQGRCHQLLSVRSLRAMGLCSYSLFLIHQPLFWFIGSFAPPAMAFVADFLLVVPLAVLSYSFIEAPAMRLGRQGFSARPFWRRVRYGVARWAVRAD